jgi:transposase
VLAYLNGEGSYHQLAIRFNISTDSIIIGWVKRYNSHIELNDYIPGGDVYMTKSRKVSKVERLEIVKYCMDHNLDYKTTAKIYEVPYANVYSWVKKYKELGEDGSGDKRGIHKNDDEVDEVELLKRQLKKYQHQLEMSQLEVRLLKKAEEIERRRSTEQANMKLNMKLLKK